jgi:hypothetical protein
MIRDKMVIQDRRNDIEPDEADIATLAKAVSRWYVRVDNKFFDVANPLYKMSMPDVQRVCILRFKEDYPEILRTDELLKAVFKRSITQMHDDPEQSVQVWNGNRMCKAGNPAPLLPEFGTVALNTWSQPGYRAGPLPEPDLGTVGDFLDVFFTRKEDQDTFLNWLAWCLRNEGDKPTWAPFFYSKTKGSGKSTLCAIVERLFGEKNTATQNNVDKLTSKFNLTMLNSKLVISEELQLRPDSTQANALKTFITEKHTISEAKGREAERVDQCCCFLFTTNHLPLWIEAEDRRYWIVEVDHDGHAAGENAAAFAGLVGNVRAYLKHDAHVAGLYNFLMQRELPVEFDAKTLNVVKDATPIMEQIFGASRQTTVDLLEEYLNAQGLNALPELKIAEIVTKEIKGNINSTKHLMSELAWQKKKLKWAGKDYVRALWIRPGCVVEGGWITDAKGNRTSLDMHLQKLEHQLEFKVAV